MARKCGTKQIVQTVMGLAILVQRHCRAKQLWDQKLWCEKIMGLSISHGIQFKSNQILIQIKV